MSHSVKKLRNKLPLLLVLAGIMGCATPRAQLNPETLLLSKAKIPLSVAIIFSSERRAREWQPDAASQGYVPRPVYPGSVLADTLLESMNLLFERVIIVDNEEEAVTRGAGGFITVEYYVSFSTTGEFKDNNLITDIKISIKDLNNATLLSVYESGVYDHTWTAVDDGAVQTALVGALNKALPRIAQSKEIKSYIENTKKNQSSMNTKKTAMTFKRRTSYEVNTDRNYIDAPFYGLRKRVAVADFDNKLEGVPESLNIGQRASEMLITELVKTGRFVVVERRILQDIVGEQQLEQTGLVRKETAAKVGSLLGAQMMVKGVISEFDEKKLGGEGALIAYKGVGVGLKSHSTHVAIDIRLIDTATGQVLHSHNAVGKATAEGLSLGITKDDITFDVEGFQNTPLAQAIRRAVFNAIRFIMRIMDDVPFEANVVKTKGNSIYINAGSLMNIQVGDRLFAYTGTALGAEASHVGTVEVIEVEDKFSIGQLVSGKGKLQRGDTLRFHQYQGVQK